MKLSIIVATRSRSAGLRAFLDALLLSECASAFSWDAWIIDNNSTDDTREVVESLAAAHPELIYYRSETSQGKSFALNRGIRESSGDVLVFTDDDCIPDPLWLQNIAREFRSRPELGIVGGRIELYNPLDLPITIRTSKERIALSNGADVFSFIAGCNMAIRREVLDRVGGFDTRLGPGSPKDTVADDPDFVYRAFRAGTGVEYVPDILIYHNHGRRSEQDARSLHRKYLRGRGAFYAKYILKGDKAVLKMAYWEFRPLLGELISGLTRRKPVRAQWESIRSLLAGMTSRLIS